MFAATCSGLILLCRYLVAVICLCLFAFGFVVGVVRVCFGVLCFFDFFVCVFLYCFVCCALLRSLLLVCLKLYVIRCV